GTALMRRIPIAATTLSLLFIPAARADDTPDLKPLAGKIETLVKKYYPKAKVSQSGTTIEFDFNTRKFWIHDPHLNGEWQDAHEEVGPRKGGITGLLELRDGPYGGMAVVPQTFDKR